MKKYLRQVCRVYNKIITPFCRSFFTVVNLKEIVMTIKVFWLAFAFLIVASLIDCEEQRVLPEILKTLRFRRVLPTEIGYIRAVLEELDQKCPGFSQKLSAADKIYKECRDRTDDSLSVCQFIRTHTLNCTQAVVKVLDDCLPEPSKGMVPLAMKSFVSAVDTLCKLDGESIFEITNPCLYETFENSTCFINLEPKLDEFKKHPTTPTQICDIAKDVRSCFGSHVDTSCHNNEKAKTAAKGFVDAIIEPCNEK